MTGEPQDSKTRPTPYDLIFGAPSFDETHFELLREQTDARPAPTATELYMQSGAGTLLRELLPDDDTAGHRERVAQMSALMFHAFRFWRHGKRVYEMTDAAMGAILLDRTEPVGEWRFRAPAPAGYVQLPRNLFWARVAADAAAEPVDGWFWSAPTAEEGVRGERLDLLLALGVRPRRPGVSLVDVGMEASGELTHWADVDARPGGTDFENVLPGGELQGYRSLTTHAEVLKLASLCFWWIDTAGAARSEDDVAHFTVNG
jgi:hypothetical protein